MPPTTNNRAGEPPRPETTFAVLLGASEYPRGGDPTLDSPKFRESARRFRQYLVERLGMPAGNIEDLFDRDGSQSDICRAITDFLSRMSPAAVRDVLVYYVGHGDTAGDTYCLYLKETEKARLLNTALPAPQLKEALGGDVLNWRLHFIIDACFAGKSVDVYQSGDGSSPSALLLKNLPDRGISFLCSSNRDHRSLAPAEADLTMFTGALLDVLEKEGDEGAGPRLSTRELCELTRTHITRRYPDKTRCPEIFPMRHREKHWPVTEMPFYPNPACPLGDVAWQVRQHWERQERRAAIDLLEGVLLAKTAPAAPLTDTDLVECLKLLADEHEPPAVIAFYYGLGHAVAKVRDYAHKAVVRHDWPKVASAVLDRVKVGDDRASEIILDGLYNSKTRKNEVDLLNQMATAVPARLRQKAKSYLRDKELRLNEESVRELFEKSGELYQIKESLGAGTLTNAYLALDTAESDGEHRAEVVLRILHDDYARKADFRDQFVQRGRQTKGFSHTNLINTYRILPCSPGGFCYTVHKYAGKYTLRDALQKRKKNQEGAEPYTAEDILLILETVVLALTPFHKASVGHCGVRPGNIFLRDVYPDIILGDPSSILGRAFASITRLGKEDDGRLIEYLRYTAPEVYRDEVSPLADFYSLGCVAYELFCGEPPFDADRWVDLFLKHSMAAVEPPSRRTARAWDSPFGAPGDAVVLKLLAKTPEERYPDIAAVLGALASLKRPRPGRDDNRTDASGPSQPPPVGRGEPPGFTSETMLRPTDEGVPPAENSASILRRVVASLDERARKLIASPTDSDPSVRPVTQAPCLMRSLVNLEDDPLTKTTQGIAAGPAPRGAESVALPGVFGRYVIRRTLGTGGFGSVYLAHDPWLDREIALKVIRHQIADNPEALTRFQGEARALARLDHPNLCPIYDIGEQGGQPYIAMRYVEGVSLAQLIREGEGVPLDRAVAVVREVAEGMAFAHDRGIIHRDLKPQNILIGRDGRPIIMDFGLARFVDHPGASRITGEGTLMGTPTYMAPEQVQGDLERIGKATDVYGIGCILYEVLAGSPPFHDSSIQKLYFQILTGEPEPPSRLRSDVPSELEAVCLRCLAKEPKERFASAGELAEALRAISRRD